MDAGAAWRDVPLALSDPLLGAGFALTALASLASSWLLVRSLERVGARLELSEALLGMLAALAADAPEITSSVAALLAGDQRVGAGVVLGSNVFNLAALIGLSGIIAGTVALHRRVIQLGGAVALWISAVALAVILGAVSPLAGLVLVGATLTPFILVLGAGPERIARLPLPARWRRWLGAAVAEEELELEVAVHPARGGARDAALALASTAAVVAASVAMERAATTLGDRHGVAQIVIGGIVLAAVTSLPNAVAAIYLAARGRGAAALSTAFNSNAFNVLAGLLIPTVIVGLEAPSSQTTYLAACYVAMTVLVIATSLAGRGLRRGAGVVIVLTYLAMASVLVAIAS